jgi:hypothetical protein
MTPQILMACRSMRLFSFGFLAVVGKGVSQERCTRN